MENQPLHSNLPGVPDSPRATGKTAVTENTAANISGNEASSSAPIPQGSVGMFPPELRHLPLRPAGSQTTAIVRSHATEMQPCPNCGTMQPTSTSVCMACGTFFPPHKAANIRCRHCGTSASANLMLCPHCGRRLQAAPSFAMRWLAPALLVVLFLLFVRQWNGTQTLQWTEAQLTAAWTRLNALGERLDPQITVVTIPDTTANTDAAVGKQVAQAGNPNPVEQASSALGELLNTEASAVDFAPTAVASTDEAPSMSGETEGDAVEPPPPTAVEVLAVITPTAPALLAPTATTAADEARVVADATSAPTPTAAPPTPSATQIPTEVPTVPPTATATSSPTLSPTLSPTSSSAGALPTATATAVTTPPRILTQTAAQQPIAAAALGENRQNTPTAAHSDLSILQPTSTFTPNPDLRGASATPTAPATATSAPTATPTDLPTPTATATTAAPTAVPPTTAPATTYVIKSGDTPSTIAARYGVSVNALLAVNGLGLDDARRLRVGQELIIPGDNQPTPTATTPATPTVAPATPTVASAAEAPSAATPTEAASSAIRLDVPQLRSPENGAFLSCGGENSLIWLPVSFIREDDIYLLHLGFLNGYNTDGTENIVWVLEQQQPAHATIWRMDEGLCSLAPQSFGRQWRWYVEVVETAENGLQPVSLPSAIWAFSWN